VTPYLIGSPGSDLAAKISPALVASLLAAEDRIVAASGGPFIRGAVRMIYPALLREVPPMSEVALDTVSREFGNMTVNDIMALIAARNAARIQREMM
jgi:hypothetical protein